MDRNTIIKDGAARLASINIETSTRFEAVAAELPELVGDDLRRLVEDCVQLADSGWRSFESLNLLLDVAVQVPDANRLLEVSAIGCQLSGYSFEPPASYFRCVLVACDLDAQSCLGEIERGGLVLQDQYRHASGLIAGYFKAAAALVQRFNQSETDSWVRVTSGLLELPRDRFTDFLRKSEQIEDVSWQFVSGIDRPESALEYVMSVERLGSRSSISAMNKLVLNFAKEDISDLLRCMVEMSGSCEPDELLLLLELGLLINDVNLVSCFFDHRSRLPLDQSHIVRKWLAEGLDQTRGNEKAARAYLSVESTRSVEMLASLEGQVSFADHSRTFDLMAEAMTGQHIMISCDEKSPDFRNHEFGLPVSDGRSVVLPSFINIFDVEDDNFGFYKVSLFHQLGYVEFGCFQAITSVTEDLNQFEDTRLAERIFMIVEDARIDWHLAARYPGISKQLGKQKAYAAATRSTLPFTRRAQLLDAMVSISLDLNYEEALIERVEKNNRGDAEQLGQWIVELRKADASVQSSLAVTKRCYELIVAPGHASEAEMDLADGMITLEELPEPIAYRGELDVATVESTLKIEALVNEIQEQLETVPDDQPSSSIPVTDPDQIDTGEMKKGNVDEGVGMLITELEHELDGEAGEMPAGDREGLLEFVNSLSSAAQEATRHVYDEWNFEIGDYLSRWCTLYEHRELEEDAGYFHKALIEHEDLARKIRQQLNKVRPEMLRKVKGVSEGEELDLERTISFLVDKKAGLTPEDSIYVQRQRKDRDVSTLFLLDMSASTDDIIPDPDAEPVEIPDVDDDEYLAEFFQRQRDLEANARRIIDLEKESVVLMAESLEKLGDSYSVCGFSGYGRDQVDYYLCKDFDEPLTALTRGRIGGIKPCRSTRMGPPIRHATRRLLETGSRIKALIIISDGYPQDHDYGADRNSRDYGLMDTMKALSEAKLQGVLTYCLTVDPSGHDYLRAMCPDSQYMVIQDIEQLPEELSRVYRSLTG